MRGSTSLLTRCSPSRVAPVFNRRPHRLKTCATLSRRAVKNAGLNGAARFHIRVPPVYGILRLALSCGAWATISSLAGCAGLGAASGGWFEPQGERWTILCLEVCGAEAARTTADVAQVLKDAPGIDPGEVRVANSGEWSRIYYGTYYRKVKPGTRQRERSEKMERDLLLLHELVDEQGRRFFLGARRVPAPGAEAEYAPWHLRNTDAVYTLQVAVYYNDSRMQHRRKAALAKCRRLREQGLEAYYYHGQSVSMVTVGAFGPDAVRDSEGRVRDLDRGGQRWPVAHRYSPEVEALQQRPECAYNLTNDNIEYNINEQGNSVPVRSMLVRVPQEEFGP